MASGKRKQKLVVAYRRLPPLHELDCAVVRTLDVHEVLSFLGGPPLFSAGTHLENLYASHCVPSDDFRTWTVTFREDSRFSDHSELTAEHWYHSIARTIRYGAGVHFNPKKDLVGAEFSKDGYCDGLELQGGSVKLTLGSPNRHFPRLIGKIEASILPILGSEAKYIDLSKAASAGPYRIESYEKRKAILSINPNFPGHGGRVGFESIELLELSDEEAVEARIRGAVDFIYPGLLPDNRFHDELRKTSQTIRDFGQTIFLSFRASAKTSPWMRDVKKREALASILRSIEPFAGLEKSSVLLMGEGMGRITSGPEIASKDGGPSLPPLSLAAVDRPYSRQIVECLRAGGLDLKVFWVTDFNGLYSGPAKDAEAMIGWNDFCAEDPYISFYNALNPDRPLFPDEGAFRAELNRIQQELDKRSRDQAYQELHGALLRSFSVIPVFHYWMDAYAAQGLNVASIKGGSLWTLEP